MIGVTDTFSNKIPRRILDDHYEHPIGRRGFNGGLLSRQMLHVLGWMFIGLAILGALLPLLPTTPFLILASSCFMRSSPRMHQRLLSMPVWGQVLRDWDQHRGVRPFAKLSAYAVIAFAMSASACASQWSPAVLLILGLLSITGVLVIRRLPVIPTS